MRICPRHPGGPTELRLTEFGVDRSTPDGLNRYCRNCNQAKVNRDRKRLRERTAALAAMARAANAPVEVQRKPYMRCRPSRFTKPGQFVFSALRVHGPMTRAQLAELARSKVKICRGSFDDYVSDAIAELHLDHRLLECDANEAPDTRRYGLKREQAA